MRNGPGAGDWLTPAIVGACSTRVPDRSSMPRGSHSPIGDERSRACADFRKQRPWPRGATLLASALVGLVFVAAPATSGAQSPATPPLAATPIPGMPSPGAPGIGDPYYPLLGNGGYDAIHYTIDLDLDVAAGTIVEATTTIDARGHARPIDVQLRFPGSPDRCRHRRRHSRRLGAGWRRADDHSRATTPCRRAFPDRGALSRHAG